MHELLDISKDIATVRILSAMHMHKYEGVVLKTDLGRTYSLVTDNICIICCRGFGR